MGCRVSNVKCGVSRVERRVRSVECIECRCRVSEILRLPQYNNDGGLNSVAPATKTARIFDTL